MNFVKKHLLTISGITVGALAGFIYWHQVGCLSGSCAITSSPVNATMYGAVMGGLIFNMFKKEKQNTEI